MNWKSRIAALLNQPAGITEHATAWLLRFWRSELLVPVLFFLFYALANAHLWKANIDETGDQALIGLQTERAAHFEETTGPYSRAGFHHPGPVSFYGYALFDRLLPFITSSDVRFRFGQLFLNGTFFVWGMALFRRLLPGAKGWVHLLSILFLVSTSPLGPGFLLSVWGPHILIVAYLLFFFAYLSILQGRGEFLALAMSAVFILHNHVSGATLLFPLAFIAAIRYTLKVRSREIMWSRFEMVHLGCAIGFALLTSIPPLIDQFVLSGQPHGMGNLSRIYLYFTKYGVASRRFDSALTYLTGYYADPLRSFLPLPGLAVFAFLSGLPLLVWNRLPLFWRSIHANLMLVFALSLFSAVRVSGDLLPHLFWHLYPFVALHYLLIVVSVLALLSPGRVAPRFLRVHALLTIMALTITIYRLPPVPAGPTEMTRLYERIRDRADPYRLVFPIGTEDHNRWVEAAGFALKIVRSGKYYCVDKEWDFMFPSGAVCPADFHGTTVELHTAGERPDPKAPGITVGGVRLVINDEKKL